MASSINLVLDRILVTLCNVSNDFPFCAVWIALDDELNTQLHAKDSNTELKDIVVTQRSVHPQLGRAIAMCALAISEQYMEDRNLHGLEDLYDETPGSPWTFCIPVLLDLKQKMRKQLQPINDWFAKDNIFARVILCLACVCRFGRTSDGLDRRTTTSLIARCREFRSQIEESLKYLDIDFKEQDKIMNEAFPNHQNTSPSTQKRTHVFQISENLILDSIHLSMRIRWIGFVLSLSTTEFILQQHFRSLPTQDEDEPSTIGDLVDEDGVRLSPLRRLQSAFGLEELKMVQKSPEENRSFMGGLLRPNNHDNLEELDIDAVSFLESSGVESIRHEKVEKLSEDATRIAFCENVAKWQRPLETCASSVEHLSFKWKDEHKTGPILRGALLGSILCQQKILFDCIYHKMQTSSRENAKNASIDTAAFKRAPEKKDRLREGSMKEKKDGSIESQKSNKRRGNEKDNKISNSPLSFEQEFFVLEQNFLLQLLRCIDGQNFALNAKQLKIDSKFTHLGSTLGGSIRKDNDVDHDDIVKETWPAILEARKRNVLKKSFERIEPKKSSFFEALLIKMKIHKYPPKIARESSLHNLTTLGAYKPSQAVLNLAKKYSPTDAVGIQPTDFSELKSVPFVRQIDFSRCNSRSFAFFIAKRHYTSICRCIFGNKKVSERILAEQTQATTAAFFRAARCPAGCTPSPWEFERKEDTGGGRGDSARGERHDLKSSSATPVQMGLAIASCVNCIGVRTQLSLLAALFAQQLCLIEIDSAGTSEKHENLSLYDHLRIYRKYEFFFAFRDTKDSPGFAQTCSQWLVREYAIILKDATQVLTALLHPLEDDFAITSGVTLRQSFIETCWTIILTCQNVVNDTNSNEFQNTVTRTISSLKGTLQPAVDAIRSATSSAARRGERVEDEKHAYLLHLRVVQANLESLLSSISTNLAPKEVGIAGGVSSASGVPTKVTVNYCSPVQLLPILVNWSGLSFPDYHSFIEKYAHPLSWSLSQVTLSREPLFVVAQPFLRQISNGAAVVSVQISVYNLASCKIACLAITASLVRDSLDSTAKSKQKLPMFLTSRKLEFKDLDRHQHQQQTISMHLEELDDWRINFHSVLSFDESAQTTHIPIGLDVMKSTSKSDTFSNEKSTQDAFTLFYGARLDLLRCDSKPTKLERLENSPQISEGEVSENSNLSEHTYVLETVSIPPFSLVAPYYGVGPRTSENLKLPNIEKGGVTAFTTVVTRAELNRILTNFRHLPTVAILSIFLLNSFSGVGSCSGWHEGRNSTIRRRDVSHGCDVVSKRRWVQMVVFCEECLVVVCQNFFGVHQEISKPPVICNLFRW
eukprot:GHVP01062827.1.p1 GENE.GHVP01062827.1~~GHVP01062827.1.p1  ORF type:complete len:1328 (-),score=206.48 GHVP01062827.1:1130-5113(-)